MCPLRRPDVWLMVLRLLPVPEDPRPLPAARPLKDVPNARLPAEPREDLPVPDREADPQLALTAAPALTAETRMVRAKTDREETVRAGI